MVTPDSQSRIIKPEVLAAEVGVDVAKIEQQAIDARIDEVLARHGGSMGVMRLLAGEKETLAGQINEYALAEVMLIFLGGRLVMDRASGNFFRYIEDKGIFKKVGRSELAADLAQLYARLPQLSSKLGPLGMRPTSVRMIRGVIEAIAGLVSEDFPFGGNPEGITRFVSLPLRDGTLIFDLERDADPLYRAGFSPTDRFLSRTKLIYDPAAGSRPERLLSEWLTPSLGREEVAQELLDYVAAAWVGGALWPFILLICGESDAGKTQLSKLISAVCGEEYCRFQKVKGMSDKFGLSFASGPKRVLIFSDESSEMLSGEMASTLKCLTGGDVLEDRGPFASDLVKIKGDKIVVLVSNSVPLIPLADDHRAIERRVRPFRFVSYRIEKIIPNFADRLLEESGAVLTNRLVEGVRRRIKLSLDGRRPDFLPEMRELMDEILRRGCSVMGFLSARLTKERGQSVTLADLWSMFCDVTPHHVLRGVTQSDFNRRARESAKRLFGVSESKSVGEERAERGLRSVRWKTEAERSDD